MKDRFKYYLHKVVEGQCLTAEESSDVFDCVMDGQISPAQIGALLAAFRIRGESLDEIIGAATAMRAKALSFEAPNNAIDMCGTGGDASSSLNVSTAVAFVVAACGVPVAKHGNRSVSSLSGSADILEHLGVNIDSEIAVMERAIKEINIGFMMAPKFHPAMRHVASVRKELGIRTLFNILGPLSNPAHVKYQLLGVYAKHLLEPMAHTLNALSTVRAWVVHGSDGLDELTITGPSYVAEVNKGKVSTFELDPTEYGLKTYPAEAIKGGDVLYNAEMLKTLLQSPANVHDAYRDIVLLNAAACLVIVEVEKDLRQAIARARDTLVSGKAYQCLEQLIKITTS
jgi:anthranilate phosphoribosyltransferase